MASPVRTPTAAPEPTRRPPATAAPAVRLSAPPGIVPASLPAPVREAVVDTTGGAAVSPEISGALRRGLGVDPSPIRVHTDARAAAATTHLGVRAFTWGSHVYLGAGERADDVGLLAHEVVHVIQQSGGAAVQLFDGPHGALEAEAHSAAGTVLAGRHTQVRGRTSGLVVQGLFDWARSGLRAVGGAIASAASAVADVGAALRDRVMGFIKERARSIPGYDLLGFILGRDPITQQPVERNAINLIRGILGLIPGGAAMFENLQKANVIQRAYDWFSAEITKLNITWPYIRGLFSQAWDALSITDLASPSGAWEKLKNIFGPPLGRLGDFAVAAGRKVLEFVFEGALALAGSAGRQILAIFRRIGAVFSLIVADPLKFLGNLLSAVKGGFGKFKDNIVAHLRTGLFEWLLGSLEGVTLPKTWDFAGILHLVLEILGLTYTALRAVLVKLIGEPAVAAVEKVFDFLVLVVTKGLGAAWDKIKEFATDLADQVIGGIRDWVTKSVVGAAVTKLVTLFNPVGAIIQGIITIYNTVMFFIERAQQIARLVNAVLDSVENIARGNLSGAIAYVEKTMASTLPVILGFLARLLGLGNVTKYVRDIITKIRTTIAGALEKVGLWIKDRVQGLLARRQQGPPSGVPLGTYPQLTFRVGDEQHRLYVESIGGRPRTEIASAPVFLTQYIRIADRTIREAAANRERVKPPGFYQGLPRILPLLNQATELAGLIEANPDVRGDFKRVQQQLAELMQLLIPIFHFVNENNLATPDAGPGSLKGNSAYVTFSVALRAGEQGARPPQLPSPGGSASPGQTSIQGTFRGVSGQRNSPTLVASPVFETRVVRTDRSWDTERKLLELLRFAIVNDLGLPFRGRSATYEEVNGRIVLVSELKICPSCQGVIEQFKAMFPRVTVQPVSVTNVEDGGAK